METPAEALLTSPLRSGGHAWLFGDGRCRRDGLPAIPFDWAVAPRLRMRGRRLQTPTLCITGLFNPRSKSY